MSDRTIRFVTVDVFTSHLLGATQLAVVFAAEGLDSATMQAIAREFNLSETVFVLPPADTTNDHRIRIFTPAVELPFAGHPTIGSAVVLAGDRRQVRLEEGIGVLVVDVEDVSRRPRGATLTAAAPFELREAELTVDEAAHVLGLSPDDIVGAPPGASAGLPFLFVELRSLHALARAQVDIGQWQRHLADDWTKGLYLYTDDAQLPGTYRARMFGPGVGVVEDSATGSAATALAGLLASRTALDTGELRWTVRQGVEMGRPSELALSALKTDGDVAACRVGGDVVAVSRGELSVTDGSFPNPEPSA